MTSTGTATAQAFLSYHRRDNETYDGVVDRLAAEIGGRFEAETGRSLQIFVDRESIPGGGDWRERIAESIASATIFIPVITMRYFASAPCREELLAFYDGADRLGVTDLILPVVLAGAINISATDPRPEVRLIERLNYRKIDEAIDKGYQSPEWKAAVRTLVTDIARGLSLAEDAIAAREGITPTTPADVALVTSPAAPDGRVDLDSNGDETSDEDDDIFVLQADFEQIPTLGNAAMASLAEFADVTKSSGGRMDQLQSMSAQQQRATLLRLAADLTPSSGKVGRDGAAFETVVRRADRRLRSLVNHLDGMNNGTANRLKEQLVEPFRSLTELSKPLDQMAEMVDMLTTVGVMNVSLRKSLEPAIRGIRAIRSGISIANSWESLGS